MKTYVELTKKEQLWKNNYEKNGGVKTTLDYLDGWWFYMKNSWS